MTLRPNPERDSIVLGDLTNFQRLGEVVDPTQDEVRLHAAAVRRLLIDGGGLLAMITSSRRLPLAFHPWDSLPFVRSFRNRHASSFVLGGLTVFGIHLGGIVDGHVDDHGAPRPVSMKLETFLKQNVAGCNGELITRHDVITYVSNKAGGVHFDQRASGRLSVAKMHAIGILRRCIEMRMIDGVPSVTVHVAAGEDQSATFRHRPDSLDAIYLEFLAAIGHILASPEVQALRAAIERDLDQH